MEERFRTMTTQSRRLTWIALGTMATALALSRCGDSGGSNGGNGGTGSSVTITAPAVVGPNATSVSDAQPTLTVSNATVSNGSTPTYSFQVASDQGFGSIVVQSSGVAQGGSETSWEVSQALTDGMYFWRARADAAGTNGPFSSVAQFALVAVGGPGETVLVFDELTGGSTLATERNGGEFLPEGWRVNSTDDFLRYEVPTVDNGYVQWQNLGLTPTGATGDSVMLFGMWDPTAGSYRQNPFRVHLEKLWGPTHNPPYIRFRWISQGRQDEVGYNFTDWDPSKVYTWRVEWGPDGGAFTARVYLDGMQIMEVGYERAYQPDTHWIEFGPSERHETVVGAIFRNFAVVRR
jgi:hypothetical protein